MQVGKATRRQSGATSGELQERLPLVRRHATQNSDEAQEARTEGETREVKSTRGGQSDGYLEPDCEDLPVSGIAQLWFGIVNDVISCPGR